MQTFSPERLTWALLWRHDLVSHGPVYKMVAQEGELWSTLLLNPRVVGGLAFSHLLIRQILF